MDAFIVFIALTLALAVAHQTLSELMPVKTPAALTRTVTVAIAALFAYGIDYSVFAAFGQALRVDWMHPVLTGVALVGTGEFIRSMVAALAHRAGEPVVDMTLDPRLRAA